MNKFLNFIFSLCGKNTTKTRSTWLIIMKNTGMMVFAVPLGQTCAKENVSATEFLQEIELFKEQFEACLTKEMITNNAVIDFYQK